MDDERMRIAITRRSGVVARRLLCLALLLAAAAVFLGVAPRTAPGSSQSTAPPPRAKQSGSTAFFAPGHVEADARTVAAMFRYLISREGSLPVTNQIPVNG